MPPSLPPALRRFSVTGVVLLLVILWLASGLFTDREQDTGELKRPPMTVMVRDSQAEPVTRQLTLQGEVQPDQVVTVRARTSGRIESEAATEGEVVEAGKLLMQIAVDDRQAKLRRAQAVLKGRESDYQAARRLAEDGLQARLRVEAAEAEMEAARAELEAVKLDLDNTRVRAPITGIYDQAHARTGDFVAVGEPIADMVESNPLRAVVQVPQQNIHLLASGMPARVHFAGEAPREGIISYVASRADTTTRTFRVEIRLDNPERQLPSGISTRVEIPIEDVLAHQISPALIGLNDDGELVVRGVDKENRVVLFPVQIVRAEADSVWITDLPETLRLITVGQGFVSAGEEVRVVAEEPGQAFPEQTVPEQPGPEQPGPEQP